MISGAGGTRWQKLTPQDRRNAIISCVVLSWAFALSVDMYMLKQRADFQDKFKIEDPQLQPQGWWSSISWPWSGSEEQEEEPEWRRTKRERAAAAAVAEAAQAAAAEAQATADVQAAQAVQTPRRWWQRAH